MSFFVQLLAYLFRLLVNEPLTVDDAEDIDPQVGYFLSIFVCDRLFLFVILSCVLLFLSPVLCSLFEHFRIYVMMSMMIKN